MSWRRLYDIPSLPESMMKQKYISTPNVYNDPNTVSNFMNAAIRDTSSDAPLFESDLPRKSNNPMAQSLLSTREHGSRYSHAPYHPELFLGDFSSDPRMSTNEPLMGQMADQHKFRHDRYIVGKLQDVADVRAEGVHGEKKVVALARDGFNDTAKRLVDLFDDSFHGDVRRANPNPGNTIHRATTTARETMIYGPNEGKLAPRYASDHVKNPLGAQHLVIPDGKQGKSSESRVYATKSGFVDHAAVATNRMAHHEGISKLEQKNIKKGTAVKQVSSLKEARKHIQGTHVNTNKDSFKGYANGKGLLPSGSDNVVDRFVNTHSVQGQLSTVSMGKRFFASNTRQESLMEPLSNNVQSVSTSAYGLKGMKSIPRKDRLTIAYQVSRTQTGRKEDTSATTATKQRFAGAKMYAKTFTARVEAMTEQANTNSTSGPKYSNGVPVKGIDHISNVSKTASKYTVAKENLVTNRAASNVMPNAITSNKFEFDTDPTMNNDYGIRRGAIQSNKTRISDHQEQDNEISPLTDLVMPRRTKYAKVS